MSLKKQGVSIPFTSGLQTSTTEFLVKPPELNKAENVVFRRAGEASKRNGYVTLSQDVFASERKIENLRKLVNYKDELLLLDDKSNAYTYSEKTEKWVEKGTYGGVLLEKTDIEKVRTDQQNPDAASTGALTLYAWENKEDVETQVSWVIIEEQTGIKFKSGTESPNTSRPRCMTLNNKLVLLYVDRNTKKVVSKTFDPNDLNNPKINNSIADVYSRANMINIPATTVYDSGFDATIEMNIPDHPLSSGSVISVETTTGIGGISADELSVTRKTVNVIDSSTVQYESDGIPTSQESGTIDKVSLVGFIEGFDEQYRRHEDLFEVEETFFSFVDNFKRETNVAAATTNSSSDVELTISSHGLSSGDKIDVQTTTGIGGIPANELSVADTPVTVIDSNTISYTVSVSATSTDTGVIDEVSYRDSSVSPTTSIAVGIIVFNDKATEQTIMGTLEEDSVKGVKRGPVSKQVINRRSTALAIKQDNLRNVIYLGWASLSSPFNDGYDVESKSFSLDRIERPFLNIGSFGIVRNISLEQYDKGGDLFFTISFVEYDTTVVPGSPLMDRFIVRLDGFKLEVTDKGEFGTVSPVLLQRNLSLVSHIIKQNNAMYLVCVTSIKNQPTHIVVKVEDTLSGSQIVSKALANKSGSIPYGTLPSVTKENEVLSTEIQFLSSENGEIQDKKGVVKLKLDTQDFPIQSVDFESITLISGGYLSIYDTQNFVEYGFHYYPDKEQIPTFVGNAPGTPKSVFADGTYSFKLMYEWSDSTGKIYRSTPSSTLSFSFGTAGPLQNEDKIDIFAPSLTLTQKENVKIVLYATTKNGSLYYRMDEKDNDPNENDVRFGPIAKLPSDLTSREFLYTTGGVIENGITSNAKLLAHYDDRAFYVSEDNPYSLFYSKELIRDRALEFSDFFNLAVPPQGGPITGLGSMDDKLVIFKEESVYVLQGRGPTDTGTDNNFDTPQQIPSEVGCVSSNSIVKTSNGLFFQSFDGVKLLDRGLNRIPIGEGVTRYNSIEISDATIVPKLDEVRLLSPSDETLVYSTAYNLWSTFTQFQGVSSVMWKGQYVKGTSNGEVHVEKENVYKDGGSTIPLLIETSWIALNELMGYQRIYEVALLGKRYSDLNLQTTVYTDYNEETPKQITYYDTEEKMADTHFNPPSSPSFTPSLKKGFALKNEAFRIRVKMKRQRSEAIKFVFSDVEDPTVDGQAFSLSGMKLLLGVVQDRNIPLNKSQNTGD